jgi:hypothetical protein
MHTTPKIMTGGIIRIKMPCRRAAIPLLPAAEAVL